MLPDNWKECWEYANYCDGMIWRVGFNFFTDCEDIYHVASQVCQYWQAWLSKLESKSSIHLSCNCRLQILLGGFLTNFPIFQSILLFILILGLSRMSNLFFQFQLALLLEMFTGQLHTYTLTIPLTNALVFNKEKHANCKNHHKRNRTFSWRTHWNQVSS